MKPEIRTFTAQPSSIESGQRARLEWEVVNARSVKIEPGVGSVEQTGRTSVVPDQTTTYTLTAESHSGEVKARTQVRVSESTPVDSLREDCISFNPNNVRLVQNGSKWLLTDGRSRMISFDVRSEGDLAIRIIRHYGLTRHCFVGRPQPSLEYFLAGDQAPSGQMSGEDCISFNPEGLEITRERSGWLLREGRHRMLMFPNEGEAEQALAIIKGYAFRQTCYVGRPQPSMTYFRR
jgi:hypothetical protein